MKYKALIFVAILFLASCSGHQVAYIDLEVIMEEYEGLKAFDRELEAERVKLRKEIESLIEPYQLKVDEYYQNVGSMSASTKSATELALQQEQAAIEEQQDKYMQQLEEMRLSSLEDINNKIAEFVADYAQSLGYKMVLGTSGTETVVYGEEELNITQEVLAALNKQYLEEN